LIAGKREYPAQIDHVHTRHEEQERHRSK
jgi:hypothetical protein